ncbi:glycosyltransferase [Merismopedia glauca]|uniref:Glycosyltransferase n=1 Tax=Merismopedia glauca CCAP 1448/3 TaxID=1296344 RepID=A0A2T1C7B2_9CYAN|nr:glycosyltransferase [Merismopedia glauca]PSB04124.1 hypothetical protein C7B64_05130 [Merismopedia glauca CCAP 1448/3]
MLIWKSQSDNIRVASNRYRCLFPVKYLKKIGYRSLIYSGKDRIHFYLKPDAIIFVKSFTPHDLNLAQTASQLGIPIILDICDNILADDYGFQSTIKPQEFFIEMSQLASVIVTTGEALKIAIENKLNISTPILIIPDGNETILDFDEYNLMIKANIYWKRIIYIFDPHFLVEKTQGTYKKFSQKISKSTINKFKLARKTLKKIINKFKFKIKKIYFYLNKSPLEDAIAYEVSGQDTIISAEPTTQDLIPDCSVEQPLGFKLVSASQPETSNFQIDPQESHQQLKQIIWFGNHGVKPGIGMLALLNIKDDLWEISQQVNFCLHIVSDNYEKYCQYIKPLPFPTRYTPWDFFVSRECISQSDVTIIPTSVDPFNVCKSANRAVLSLSLGVPVVATKTPALIPFQDCSILDDWKSGILSYLTNPELVDRHIAKAQEIISQDYSGEAIARQWADAINLVIAGKI